MKSTSVIWYFAVGFSMLCVLVPFVGSDHLWKPRFFRWCLIASVVSFVAGLLFEVTNILHQELGFATALMSIPLIYLMNFQLCRSVFKRRFNTEPYVTSTSSSIGAPPLDLFSPANIDGEHRKYDKDRRIMAADFVFSFAQALISAFTALILIFLTTQNWR